MPRIRDSAAVRDQAVRGAITGKTSKISPSGDVNVTPNNDYCTWYLLTTRCSGFGPN